MKLDRNWLAIARHAWSLRLNLGLALLSGLDSAVTYFVDGKLSSGLVVFGISIAASVARVLHQDPLAGEDE